MTLIRKIAFVGQREYFRMHYENDLNNIYEVYSHQLRYGADEDYYARLVEFDADANIFFRGELVPMGVIERLNGLRIAISTEPFPKLRQRTFQYTLDSLNRFKNFLPILQMPFDFIFHYDRVSKDFLESQGVYLSGFEMLPIATGVYFPHSGDRSRDVLFVGRSTPHRERFLGAIKRDFDCLHIAHGLPTTALPALAAQFKLSLNLHAEDEVSCEPRVQLMLACGDLLLSEPISQNPFIKPGAHFIEARSPEEVYEACRSVISNVDQYNEIREAGCHAVRAALSSNTQWPKLLNDIVDGRYLRPRFECIRVRLGPLEVCKKYAGFDHLLDELVDFHA